MYLILCRITIICLYYHIQSCQGQGVNIQNSFSNGTFIPFNYVIQDHTTPSSKTTPNPSPDQQAFFLPFTFSLQIPIASLHPHFLPSISATGSLTLQFTHRADAAAHEDFPVYISTNPSPPLKNAKRLNRKVCIYSVSISPHETEKWNSDGRGRGTAFVCRGLSLSLHTASFVLQISPLETSCDGNSPQSSSSCWKKLHQISISHKSSPLSPIAMASQQLEKQLHSTVDATLQRNKRNARRSTVTSSSPLEPIQSTVYGAETKYVLELYLIVDQALSRSYRNRHGSYDRLLDELKLMMCDVNEAFSVFNITVVIVRLEIWEVNVKDFAHSDDLLLYQLEQYKRSYHVRRVRHDCLHVLLGHDHQDSKYSGGQGRAYKNTMCSATRCVGFSRIPDIPFASSISTTALASARTVVHELGHNFGLRHDTEDCLCEGCLMAATVPFERQVFMWSPCSLEQMGDVLRNGGDICLHDDPESNMVEDPMLSTQTKSSHDSLPQQGEEDAEEALDNFGVSFVTLNAKAERVRGGMSRTTNTSVRPQLPLAVCGNRIVEPGEQCDCGRPDSCTFEESTCCNPRTCQLRGRAECAQGPCCDVSRCALRHSGFQCRGYMDNPNPCDLPEYCDGSTPHCPADRYVADGVECSVPQSGRYSRKSRCFGGRCADRESQCGLLWGDTGRPAPAECFQMNRKLFSASPPLLDCGKKKPIPKDSLDHWERVDCPREEDAECGRLWCSHENVRLLHMGDYREAGPLTSPPFHSQCSQAVAVSLDVNGPLQDPGLVPNGSPCGHPLLGKVCWNATCVSQESLNNVTPSSCHCNGNGVCNDLGQCHCYSGFEPPTCRSFGYGGSVSSGPPPTPAQVIAFRVVILISLLIILPLAFFCTCYLLRQHPGTTGSKVLDRCVYCKLKLEFTTTTANINAAENGGSRSKSLQKKPPPRHPDSQENSEMQERLLCSNDADSKSVVMKPPELASITVFMELEESPKIKRPSGAVSREKSPPEVASLQVTLPPSPPPVLPPAPSVEVKKPLPNSATSLLKPKPLPSQGIPISSVVQTSKKATKETPTKVSNANTSGKPPSVPVKPVVKPGKELPVTKKVSTPVGKRTPSASTASSATSTPTLVIRSGVTSPSPASATTKVQSRNVNAPAMSPVQKSTSNKPTNLPSTPTGTVASQPKRRPSPASSTGSSASTKSKPPVTKPATKPATSKPPPKSPATPSSTPRTPRSHSKDRADTVVIASNKNRSKTPVRGVPDGEAANSSNNRRDISQPQLLECSATVPTQDLASVTSPSNGHLVPPNSSSTPVTRTSQEVYTPDAVYI